MIRKSIAFNYSKVYENLQKPKIPKGKSSLLIRARSNRVIKIINEIHLQDQHVSHLILIISTPDLHVIVKR